MQLTETHCHTGEVSLCGMVPAREIPALYRTHGYGAIIVTDHYNRWTLDALAMGRTDQIERWLEGYRQVRAAGAELGMRVFLGMELALTQSPEDFLIYGFDEEFLFRYPNLIDGSLEEAFHIVEDEGLLLYQAHPFRSYLTPAPACLLHGVEVFNGNPRQDNNNDRAVAFAESNNLKKTAGSDFHQLQDVGRGGVWLPDDIHDNGDLIAYLRTYSLKLYIPC